METYELKLSSIAKWQIYGFEFAQEHGLYSIGTSSQHRFRKNIVCYYAKGFKEKILAAIKFCNFRPCKHHWGTNERGLEGCVEILFVVNFVGYLRSYRYY